MLKPKEHEPEETKKSEAYITFQRDMSAFAAVADNENLILKKIEHMYKMFSQLIHGNNRFNRIQWLKK